MSRRGYRFTLVELLIVLAILGIIAAIAFATITGSDPSTVGGLQD